MNAFTDRYTPRIVTLEQLSDAETAGIFGAGRARLGFERVATRL
jgi:hypothetical protein